MPPNIKFQDADYWSEVAHEVTFLSKPEEQGPKTPVDEQEETIGQRLWNKRKECPEDEDIFAVIDDEVKKCWEALKSIKILHNKESCQEWLTEFGGTLYDVPLEVLEADDIPTPSKFTAKVADFNDNLFYQMQTRKGLGHLGALSALEETVPANEKLASFLQTESTTPQPAHVDYNWEVLTKHGQDLQVGFAPLTKDGMFLQVWPTAPPSKNAGVVDRIQGQIIFVPYGKLLIVPASTIHGGGFRTNPKHGNLRFHLYLAQGDDAKLPDYQQNKYTEPHDKSRELCERYVDTSHMQVLLNHLFI